MNHQTVLHVDDDPDDAYFLQQALVNTGSGVEVQSADSGVKAIKYLTGAGEYGDRTQYPLPDLVLLDIKMPVMNGFEFLTWLRQQEQFRGLPVIMLSSSNDPQDIARANQLGATGYLVKYIGFMGVATAVAKVLNSNA